MSELYLTSSANFVAQSIATQMGGVPRNSLVFITTATEVEEGDLTWLDDDRNALIDAGFDVTDYTITHKTEAQLVEDLSDYDTICLSGGNTFYLLEKIQQSGFKQVVHDLVTEGTIYIGTSAGSVVAGPDIYPTYKIDSLEKAPNLQGHTGLELVDFVVLPHWGSSHFKDLYLNHRLEHTYTNDHKLILLTDHQYIHVQGDYYRIIDTKPS